MCFQGDKVWIERNGGAPVGEWGTVVQVYVSDIYTEEQHGGVDVFFVEELDLDKVYEDNTTTAKQASTQSQGHPASTASVDSLGPHDAKQMSQTSELPDHEGEAPTLCEYCKDKFQPYKYCCPYTLTHCVDCWHFYKGRRRGKWKW